MTSMLVPLSVRLQSANTAMHITSRVADVSFSSTSPGGYGECTVTLHSPISFTPAEVEMFGQLVVFDGQTGDVVWEGILQDPGRTAGSTGEVWELTGVGGSAHLQDDTRQLYYVDADPNHWDRIDVATAAAEVQYLQDTGAVAGSDTPALSLRIPQATTVDGAIPSRVVACHRGIAASGMEMAYVAFDWDTGLTATSLVMSLYAATEGIGAADVPWTATFNSAGGSVSRDLATWTLGRNRPILRYHYTGPLGQVSADTWWMQISNLTLRTILYQKNGSKRLAGGTYTTGWVLADEIVTDLLGRILTPTIDTDNAIVTNTTYQIDHLVYPDGATPGKILDDLMLLENAYTYHVWGRNPDNGKFTFEWVPWPTTVRYEADVHDGFTASSSGATVYNRVAVRYHNRGTIRVPIRTQSVPALTAAGFDRTAFIDLGDEASTANNATRVGDQFLADHQHPVNGGSLTVARKIVDLKTGRMVNPWEIRPGNLIRVRGVESYPDALNEDGRDGVTIFKIAATSFSSETASARLDLDSYTPSASRAIAEAMRRPRPRRR